MSCRTPIPTSIPPPTETPPPWTPQPTPICHNREQPICMPMAPGNFWGRFVKGWENWFHPMCVSPKCTILNGELKIFIFPHHLGLGFCSHMDCSPQRGPREDRGYVEILISPHCGDGVIRKCWLLVTMHLSMLPCVLHCCLLG